MKYVYAKKALVGFERGLINERSAKRKMDKC